MEINTAFLSTPITNEINSKGSLMRSDQSLWTLLYEWNT
jgi:hypothetical protein